MCFSPDDQLFAVGDDGGVHIWRRADATDLFIEFDDLENSALAVEFSPDSRTLAIATAHGVMFWNIETQAVEREIDEKSVTDIAWSPTGDLFAVAGEHAAQIRSVADARITSRFDPGLSHPSVVEFSPDGRTIAIGDTGGDVSLFDVSTGERLWRHRIGGISPLYIPHKFKLAMLAIALMAAATDLVIHIQNKRLSAN